MIKLKETGNLKKALYIFTLAALLTGCYSNNCPMENYVSCNIAFYDQDGDAVNFTDTLTVTTLLPGYKTQYTYRQLGYAKITKDKQDSSLIKAGYTEKIETVRKDTILVNKLTNAHSFKVPMSYFHDQDTLVLKYAGISNPDTIRITHTSYPHVELPECGTYRFHTLHDIWSTHNYIYQTTISNSKVNYDGAENIHILFNGTVK